MGRLDESGPTRVPRPRHPHLLASMSGEDCAPMYKSIRIWPYTGKSRVIPGETRVWGCRGWSTFWIK